jgi:hypothetical protein
MTYQERAEAYLRKHPGMSFCAACIARALEIPPVYGRSILWALQALPGYEMRGTLCTSCRRGKRTIRYLGGGMACGAAPEIVAFLVSHAKIFLCDACLAFSVRLSLAEVQRVVASLAALPEFVRQAGRCAVCIRASTVLGAVVEEVERGDARVITETQRHRGWRIDLSSYPTPDGWRPFCVIKAPVNQSREAPRWPLEAPTVLKKLRRTKIDADEAALHAARAWIDAHLDDAPSESIVDAQRP